MKEQIFKLVIESKLIDATKPDQLEIADSNVYLKSDATKKVSIRAVAAQMANVSGPLISRGFYATKRTNWMHHQWCADVAEVEVDADTGEYKVINVWAESDVGRIGWYVGAINQFYGGQTNELGLNCFESMVKDEATGITLNPDYIGYKIPTHADIPTYNLYMFENRILMGQWASRVLRNPWASYWSGVANADYNAVGARVNDTPVTPDKILKALGKA